jgi:Kef-type K+ transport system membrane component KefB
MTLFPIADPVAQLAAVLLLALIVQLPLERSRVPGIVGLILAGMIVGPGALHLIPDEPVVELFGTVGLLYIMFQAGLEVDLDIVREHKREAAGFGLLALGISFALALGVGLALGLSWAGALLIAAALGSHTLVSYPVIAKLGLVRRRPVVAAIGGTLLTDTGALIVLVVVLDLAAAEGGGLSWALPLVLLAALAAFAFAAVPRFAALVFTAEIHTPAERALFALVVLLVLAAAAEAIGTEDILGAFLAGLCLNRALHRRREVHEHVAFVGRMVFIPIFFIDTGMRLELDAFAAAETWITAAALIGVVVVAKLAAVWIAGRRFGYGTDARAVMLGLTLPQAAATLAVVTTAREAGHIEPAIVDAVIVTIFATCLAGALITRLAGERMARRAREAPRASASQS